MACLLARAVALGACLTASACGSIAPDVLCKPVVPQVAIDLGQTSVPEGLNQISVLYDERGAVPWTREKFTRNPRFGFCDFEGTSCISGRARYEVRTDPERFQSIQLRGNGFQENRILGGVRWKGPAYPHRIEMECDFTETDPRRTCRIANLLYEPNYDTSGQNGEGPKVVSHDQCRPRG